MTMQLLTQPTPPTALFAASDELGMGALQAAHRLGLHVPNDLAIIGYDDIDLAPLLGLSTIRQPMTEMGRESVALLLRRLADPAASPTQRALPVELVVRTSTVAEANPMSATSIFRT